MTISGRRRGVLSYTTSSIFTLLAFALLERRVSQVEEIASLFDFDLLDRPLYRRKIQRYLAGLRIGVFNGEFHPGVLHLEDAKGREIPVDEDRGLRGISESRIASVRLIEGRPEVPA